MLVLKIKKAKDTKRCIIKKIKFENYENCLKATQLENKINIQKKNKIDIYILQNIIKNS